ncbi:hypothetical protein RIF29_30069 [Crotalaria pallida]|uniref:Uncharacterized protein n=1 Tax=Crotalaria pallida TaxID=3830 RepID=A0AAN9HY04_CROPI
MSTFDVDDKHKRYILKAASNSHGQWRTDMKEHIYDKDGNINFTPPEGYNIHVEHWRDYVIESTEDESFMKLSEENNKRASNQKYKYRGSRAGYRGIEEDKLIAIGKDPSVTSIDPDTLWVEEKLHAMENNKDQNNDQVKDQEKDQNKDQDEDQNKVHDEEENKDQDEDQNKDQDEDQNKEQVENQPNISCPDPSVKDSCTFATHNMPEVFANLLISYFTSSTVRT